MVDFDNARRWYFVAKHVICNVAKRSIFVKGDIFFITFTLVENSLKRLKDIGSHKPINFFITSVGGDCYASFQIYQLIRSAGMRINTIAVDFANSGAFLIMQAGEKRFATKNTTFGFHMAKETKGSMAEIFKRTNNDVNAKVLTELAQNLNLIDAQQLIIFSERGRPIFKIKELFLKNTEIFAEQALKLKLIDGILPKSKIPKI